MPTYTLTHEDEEPVAIDLTAFLQENEDLDAQTREAIMNLQPGESYEEGGGASPTWSITHTAFVPRPRTLCPDCGGKGWHGVPHTSRHGTLACSTCKGAGWLFPVT